MYCPKCGARNQDELVYCRECGENLQVILQVMKRHLPIALISKLDAAIEKKDERFRRDAVLGALMGTVFLLTTLFMPFDGNFFSFFNVITFILGLFAFSSGGWSYLTYRRSQELAGKRANLSLKSGSLLLEKVPVGSIQNQARETAKLSEFDAAAGAAVFCPRCGLKNQAAVLYCRDCGTNLDFSARPQGLEKNLPAALIKKMDAAIIKNEEKGFESKYKSGYPILLLSGVYLVNAVVNATGGRWSGAAFYIVLAVVMVVTSGWDLIAYRRSAEERADLSAPSLSTEIFRFLSASQNRTKLAGAAIFFLVSLPLIYFGFLPTMAFPPIALILIAALILNFIRFRQSANSDDGLAGETTFSTNEESNFSNSPETSELVSEQPLTLAEGTTKPLAAASEFPLPEELPTARISRKEGD